MMALREQLAGLEQEIRDLGTAGSMNCFEHLGIADPLPGMLQDARDRAAGVRRAILAARWRDTAIAIVDALLEAPGVTVPEAEAGRLAETIAGALEAAYVQGRSRSV